MSIQNPGDLALQLPATTYHQLVQRLRGTLPPPLTDDPENLIRRNQALIARIAALCPANPAEADVAALYVAASEQWKHGFRLAQQPDISPEWAMKCRAQANSMMRQEQSVLRLLLRMQAAREKRESTNESCDRAAWTEHCALGLMAEALEPHARPLAAQPLPPPEPPPDRELMEEPQPDLLAGAEQYAITYPERAALIRRNGGLPENVTFGPPGNHLVEALRTADGPISLPSTANTPTRPSHQTTRTPMCR